MDEDEFMTYKPEEKELTLCHISLMVDTLLEQLMWLKVIVEEALEKETQER